MSIESEWLTGLTVETVERPTALWTDRPRFGWRISPVAPGAQAAYEVRVIGPDGSTVAETGRVESAASASVEVPGLVLRSRTAYAWGVRAWFDGGGQTEWVESSLETTILDPRDWRALWVEPEQIPVDRVAVDDSTASLADRLHPAPIIRQVFELDSRPGRSRLYMTAHGVFEARINGRPVSDEVLSPGSDAHPMRLSVMAYDVTDLMVPGRNVVAVTLGDGWWAGHPAFGKEPQYGNRLGVLWQLEADGESIAVSGRSAVSSFGGIRYSDSFVGEKYDAREVQAGWDEPGFDDGTWTPVGIGGGSVAGLVPFIGEPVRRVAEISDVTIVTSPRGETIVDLGQNIAGWLRLTAEGPAGTTITIEHTESLDRDGNFIFNIEGWTEKQTDVWVLAGEGRESFEPRFTFHGFRYARVTGYPGELCPGDVTGVAISSDLAQTGEFETDDPRINRLHANVVWTQRANFLSIPTDCPTRERAGWSGDLQSFAPAAINNMKLDRFLERWLANARAEQFSDGQVPMIVPNIPSFQRWRSHFRASDSAAGWSDAITFLPLTLFERYGDRRVLEDNLDAMTRWVEYCRREAATRLPERYRGLLLDDATRERQSLLHNTGHTFGDWLTPSTIDPEDTGSTVRVMAITGEIVTAMFSAKSLDNLATAAEILGDTALATESRSRLERIKAAFAEEYLDQDSRLSVHLQGMYVLALAFDLVPADRRDAAARHLIDLIDAADEHLDTGILSTPYLLDVLVDVGRADLAYRILLQETAPSWLLQVERGATTLWESWWGIAEDGQPDRLSLNHYVFGSVDDWFYRHIAGIHAVEPGYRRILFEPDVTAPFGRVRAAIETPYGRASSGYERSGDGTVVRVEVPGNVAATLRLPGQPDRTLTAGLHEVRA